MARATKSPPDAPCELTQSRSRMSVPRQGDLGLGECQSSRYSSKRDRILSKNPPPPSLEGPKNPAASRKKRAGMLRQVRPTALVEPWTQTAWPCNSCQATCGKASWMNTFWLKSFNYSGHRKIVGGRKKGCPASKRIEQPHNPQI